MQNEVVKKKKRGRPPKVKFPEGYSAEDFKCDCSGDCALKTSKDHNVQLNQAALAEPLSHLTKRTGHEYKILLGYRCPERMKETGFDSDLPYEEGKAAMVSNSSMVHPAILTRHLNRIFLEEGLPKYRLFMRNHAFWISFS